MFKKLARKDDVPVVELSQTTSFIYDKVAKKWITVDSKTMKPIKMEVTQCRAEDKLSNGQPKPMPLPKLTKPLPNLPKIPQPVPGQVPRTTVKTLEARYGKPMIPVADMPAVATPMFPMPVGQYSEKNAKVFVPKFTPTAEDTANSHN
ncbi:hypothetical protein NEHOM01_2390 [Nematocida homosporus]|uniref:uncharacterized protein n=1 Tax=Nematocida homosporus TaxID=1912981 RepID=UPI0022201624|nr:uncharacterized protein NEHOM01_2390 [Nematocida homosporus]KAI5187817.1 hypothetical protein NEHOM01_2390 [Nematocida homosporus]